MLDAVIGAVIDAGAISVADPTVTEDYHEPRQRDRGSSGRLEARSPMRRAGTDKGELPAITAAERRDAAAREATRHRPKRSARS